MEKVIFFWSGWDSILRILLVGSITYVALIFLLRIAGKRTLSRMTAFDFVIAITIGSAFGRILTASSVSISESVVTFGLLMGLQVIFSFLEIRFPVFHRLTTAEPTLLYHHGVYLEKNMSKVRMRKDALWSAARKKGYGSMDAVEAIIFEIDGTFSVIGKGGADQNLTYGTLADKDPKI